MNKKLDNLINDLKDTLGEKLVSIVLYGSCVTGDCEGSADINAIIVVENLQAADLKQSYNAVRAFSRGNFFSGSKNPLPLFMDKDEWFNSCDVYPIEYSDIKDRYEIVYGEDVVAPLQLEKSNLRLQCEYEVKNLLIKLRQIYLGESNNSKEIKNLLLLVAKSFFALFRAILRIESGADVSFDHKVVIEKLSEKVGISSEGFLELLAFRDNHKAIPPQKYDEVVQKLIDSTNKILNYVDKIS